MTSVLNGAKFGETTADIGESIADDGLVHVPYAGLHYLLGPVRPWLVRATEDPFEVTVEPVDVGAENASWPAVGSIGSTCLFGGAIFFVGITVSITLDVYRWIPGTAPVLEISIPAFAGWVNLFTTPNEIYLIYGEAENDFGCLRRGSGNWATSLKAQLPGSGRIFVPAYGFATVGNYAYIIGAVGDATGEVTEVHILRVSGSVITGYTANNLKYAVNDATIEYAPVGGIMAFGSKLYFLGRITGVFAEAIPATGCKLFEASFSDLTTWSVTADLNALASVTLNPGNTKVINKQIALPWRDRLYLSAYEGVTPYLYRSGANILTSWAKAITDPINDGQKSMFLVQ